MTSFSQVVGESRFYQQVIANDTIVSASWSASPAGTTVDTTSITSTSATARFSATQAGGYVLTVTMVCASGQTLIGQAHITVSPK